MTQQRRFGLFDFGGAQFGKDSRIEAVTSGGQDTRRVNVTVPELLIGCSLICYAVKPFLRAVAVRQRSEIAGKCSGANPSVRPLVVFHIKLYTELDSVNSPYLPLVSVVRRSCASTRKL